MNIVLLSGGSGKRLWPLSNDVRSKQFLKLFKNDDGEYESMVQRVCRQLDEACSDANVVIATSESQRASIANQLGERANVCVEPERRDTFAAVMLACAYLKYQMCCGDDEVAVIAPVDPYTDSSFFKQFQALEHVVCTTRCELALIGTSPTYPSAKYGYIIPKRTSEAAESLQVAQFKEKPDEETAARYISEGGLWNCGVFALTIGRALSYARKYIDFSCFSDIVHSFSLLPKISFDFEVVERVEDIRMVVYNGQWKDLGTWNTLAEAMGAQTFGNVIVGKGCEGTSVVNELDIPVFVMGIKDAIVASSADGVIVSDKRQSSYIKPYVDALEAKPQYVEKAWGDYHILNSSVVGNTGALTRSLHVRKGCSIGQKCHSEREETLVVAGGSALLSMSGERLVLNTGDSVRISRGVAHELIALEDLELI
ncbi:MAG: sugar phosphate nucleotidyltransferase, partial [Oscillospiraceae bacterium]